MIKNFRNFLKNNEIFFTTITTVSLSVMAIVLTINSNRLIETQIGLDRSVNQPDFYISNNYILDNSTNRFDEVELKIRKLSGIAKNVKVTNSSIFELSYEDSLQQKRSTTFQLQHLFDQSISGYESGSNVIKLLTGYKNNLRQSDFRNGIELKLEQMGYSYVFTNITTIIKIEFIDFNGDKRNEYYKSKFRDGIKIDASNDHLLETRESKRQIYLDDIENMNLDEIALRIITTF